MASMAGDKRATTREQQTHNTFHETPTLRNYSILLSLVDEAREQAYAAEMEAVKRALASPPPSNASVGPSSSPGVPATKPSSSSSGAFSTAVPPTPPNTPNVSVDGGGGGSSCTSAYDCGAPRHCVHHDYLRCLDDLTADEGFDARVEVEAAAIMVRVTLLPPPPRSPPPLSHSLDILPQYFLRSYTLREQLIPTTEVAAKAAGIVTDVHNRRRSSISEFLPDLARKLKKVSKLILRNWGTERERGRRQRERERLLALHKLINNLI